MAPWPAEAKGVSGCRGGAEGEPRGACLRVLAAAPRAEKKAQQATCTERATRVKGV